MTHAACQDESGGSKPKAKGKGPLLPRDAYIHRCIHTSQKRHNNTPSPSPHTLTFAFFQFPFMNIIGASALGAALTRSCMNVWLTLRPLRAVVVHSSRTPTMNSCSKLPPNCRILAVTDVLFLSRLCREFSSKDLRTVGNYTLGRLIGKGSFGKVYLASHKLTNGSKVRISANKCVLTWLEKENLTRLFVFAGRSQVVA